MFEPVKVNFVDSQMLCHSGRIIVAYSNYGDIFELRPYNKWIYKSIEYDITELNRLITFDHEYTFIWMKKL